MDNEERKKIIDFIASDMLNQLNFGGILNATKWWCIESATKKIDELTPEQHQEILTIIARNDAAPVINSDEEAEQGIYSA